MSALLEVSDLHVHFPIGREGPLPWSPMRTLPPL